VTVVLAWWPVEGGGVEELAAGGLWVRVQGVKTGQGRADDTALTDMLQLH